MSLYTRYLLIGGVDMGKKTGILPVLGLIWVKNYDSYAYHSPCTAFWQNGMLRVLGCCQGIWRSWDMDDH